jgi:hypothetical protein
MHTGEVERHHGGQIPRSFSYYTNVMRAVPPVGTMNFAAGCHICDTVLEYDNPDVRFWFVVEI